MATVDFTRIASNIAALNSLNALRNVNSNLAMHQTRLATGRRIDEAGDDPAGLTLATKLQRRSEGLQQAIENIGDAKNLLAVGEGGLRKVQDILGKMRLKAEQSASDTLGTAERAAIAGDLAQYAQEIDNIVDNTKWNGNKLVDGSANYEFQTSADTDAAGYTTWAQSTDHHVDGGALSGLASVAAASSAAIGTDPDTGMSAVTDTAVFSNMSSGELSTATYTVRLSIGATVDGTGADSTAQLIDANGNVVNVDADGVEGGALDTAVTFAYDDDASTTVNFGNGLQITVSDGIGASTDVADATVDYTKAGSYSITLSSASDGRDYMDTVDAAISTVSSSLADIGALMTRFSAKEEALAVTHTNTEAAFNRVMNADMAMEQLNAVKFQILQQTATSMLAQANAAPQNILSLFR